MTSSEVGAFQETAVNAFRTADYDKLGVDTRAGAVSVAKEQRLLP
ncbi:hypothetical protein [Streptomyces sp. NPDC088755]